MIDLIIVFQTGGRNSIISGEAAKKILDKFANLLNFLHFQPLISGEAAASPVPTPLVSNDLKLNIFTHICNQLHKIITHKTMIR